MEVLDSCALFLPSSRPASVNKTRAFVNMTPYCQVATFNGWFQDSFGNMKSNTPYDGVYLHKYRRLLANYHDIFLHFVRTNPLPSRSLQSTSGNVSRKNCTDLNGKNTWYMDRNWVPPHVWRKTNPPVSSKGCCLNPKGWCIGTPNIIHLAPLGRSRHVSTPVCFSVRLGR